MDFTNNPPCVKLMSISKYSTKSSSDGGISQCDSVKRVVGDVKQKCTPGTGGLVAQSSDKSLATNLQTWPPASLAQSTAYQWLAASLPPLLPTLRRDRQPANTQKRLAKVLNILALIMTNLDVFLHSYKRLLERIKAGRVQHLLLDLGGVWAP